MGERLMAVCDRCRKKQTDEDGLGVFVNFLRRHNRCNFTGCRVVKPDNPCPNRARHYTVEEPGLVWDQGYQEVFVKLTKHLEESLPRLKEDLEA